MFPFSGAPQASANAALAFGAPLNGI